ncbi:MAG: diaminopimelate decarboxylase [Candidatus Omnitrophica bacterium]|nr:diaminopimelate decarboxylase [Candidatus Omnitrophota bacterium]
MHEFKYRRNQLYCEGLKVEELARRFLTPLYIYSKKTLLDHYLKLKKAFRALDPLICFSVKANSNLAILKTLVDQGAGLDIVSGGELFRALRVGCPRKKIVYASVGKTNEEIRAAINAGILFFNVESLPELENINRISGLLRKRTRVALRVNPGISAGTHKFITTGESTNKFGIDLSTAYDILQNRRYFVNSDICGLHMHIGSQITQSSSFVKAINKIVQFIYRLKREGIDLEYLNIGGGLGIIYDKETPQTASDFSKSVSPALRKTGQKIILEPGRFIAGNAGILVVKVLYIKNTPKKKFIIIDGAMNDLIRPALYGAYHSILPLKVTGYGAQDTEKYDVVGPICESGDFFAEGRIMPRVHEGDLLSVMSSGAYGFSMSSNYNSRLRAAEVMVNKNKASLIRKRDTCQDLIRNESIPRI